MLILLKKSGNIVFKTRLDTLDKQLKLLETKQIVFQITYSIFI